LYFNRHGENNGANDLYMNENGNTPDASDMLTSVEKDILVRILLFF
jgi:hypothetical protein